MVIIHHLGDDLNLEDIDKVTQGGHSKFERDERAVKLIIMISDT